MTLHDSNSTEIFLNDNYYDYYPNLQHSKNNQAKVPTGNNYNVQYLQQEKPPCAVEKSDLTDTTIAKKYQVKRNTEYIHIRVRGEGNIS
jgi:hypothetical protein